MRRKKGARTTLGRLRAANLEIRHLRSRLAQVNEDADVYAESLLVACGGSVADAYDYVNDQRKKLAEAKRVAEMRRPNKTSPSEHITNILTSAFDSARFKISQHAVFFAERPDRGGYIKNLTVPG